MKEDKVIFDIIEREHQRQKKGIELIASENFVSDQVMRAMGSCLTNKYAEGYPGHRYYGGCEVVDESESIAIERLKELFGAQWANVQPHSGAQANMAVFMACLNLGDKFLGLNLSHGGHLSHGSPVNFSGLVYQALEYNVDRETGRIDYEQMEEVARRERPRLIVGGASAYSREWDYARMRRLADEIGAIFMVDMAHPSGLIAAGLLDNPVKYAHIVTTTTHKTLRGPRGGVIMMGQDFENPWGKTTPKGVVKMMSQLLDSAVFPGVQGGPLEHVIAAKAVAFGEALSPEFREYQLQVQKNAATLAGALIELHPRRPPQQIPRTHRQGSRKSPRARRHHRQQKHGSLRLSQPLPDLRHPPRHPRHYNPRRQGTPHAGNRRDDRHRAPQPRKPRKHRSRPR